ncbi:MAG: heparinase II/III family protein [Pirellulales bacterium]|nr:heparinase II/III family protein [Pirellulales bacterium]
MLPMRLISLSILLVVAVADVSPAFGIFPPSEKQIEKWAKLLPEHPRGVGPTIDDRRTWDRWAADKAGQAIIERAEKMMAEPMADFPKDLYLDFSRSGNRARFENAHAARNTRFSSLVMAECMENRGRFLPAIEAAVQNLCGDPTWVLPAHDPDLNNFHGKETYIDLGAAGWAWRMAAARYWLADKLSPATRKLIADQLERRTFAPFVEAMKTGKPRMWWIDCTNNWNAVCLDGVTGSALATIESRRQRAFFAAAAENQIKFYLSGFTPDGYCSEGLAYWNYGFVHFAMLAETLRRAGGGEVDLFQWPNVENVARFGQRLEILPGVYPAFADCPPATRPNATLTALLARRYGWPQRGPNSAQFETVSSTLFITAMNYCASSPQPRAASMTDPEEIPLRDWFPDAGVLICRPAAADRHALGAALKAGHNAEHHNHNDVGSFVVALGKSTPLLDPGKEVYTRRTFSNKRYESKVINSFGHPVPRVAGRLQSSGSKAAAKVLKTEFTDDADTLALDLAAAYQVEQLNKLTRTFVFSRDGDGRLTVTDRVEFDSPQSFESALVTFDDWKRLAPNRLRIGKSPDDVIVEIDAGGAAFRVVAEKIVEDLPDGRIPTRLGIELIEPIKQATVTLSIEPAR